MFCELKFAIIMSSSVIKTEPISDGDDVVEVSSDDELSNVLTPIRNEVVPPFNHPRRPGTPETQCSICLGDLVNRCYTNMCIHMFCFECLKRWASIESFCPLCKKKFQIIKHTLTDHGFQVYEVPVLERDQRIHLPLPPMPIPMPRISVRQPHEVLEPVVVNGIVIPREWRPMTSQPVNVPFSSRFFTYSPNVNGNIVQRTDVYRLNIWATPLPDLSGRFRDCSAAYYRANPAQMHRLHGFIFRDIAAIVSVDNMALAEDFDVMHVLSLICESLLTYEITDSFTINMLRPYLGTRASHFCHELYNYAHSPYDLMGYDRNVRYRQQYPFEYQDQDRDLNNRMLQFEPVIENVIVESSSNSSLAAPRLETIVLGSDDDSTVELFPDEVITLETSSDDNSDVEIIDSFNYVNPPNLSNPSRDLPSTSTGVRDSLDQPNRYNLRRRRLSSPHLNSQNNREMQSDLPISAPRIRPHLPRRAAKRITEVVSSSDDEDLTNGVNLASDGSSLDEDFESAAVPARNSHPFRAKAESLVAKKRRRRKFRKTKPRKKVNVVGDSKIENRIRSRSYSESSTSSCDTNFRPNNNCVQIN